MSSSANKVSGLAEILEAQKRISSTVLRAPLKKCRVAFDGMPTELFFKCENEQLAGSFKIRGALSKMSALSDQEKSCGVVTSSAGNHAQGVAYSAKKLNLKAHIVMPVTTPIVKVAATKSYGADVILQGEIYDEAYQAAKKLADEKGYTFVHAYNDPQVIAGQGTIGLELLEDLPDVDMVVIPIGGGGLISGIAAAIKAKKPKTKIVGVVHEQAPGMFNLFYKKPPVEKPKRISTIAEGIAVKTPSPEMFENYISKYVDEIVTVDDNDIAQAIVFLLEKVKTVVEGAGAAGMAAIMAKKIKNLGAKTAVILCGGNIDLNVIERVIERGLRLEHRLARIEVIVDDLPGSLKQLTQVVAESRANILEVYHDRVSSDLVLRQTRIDLLVETSSAEHIEQLHKDIQALGFKVRAKGESK